MSKLLEKIDKDIERIALEAVTLECGDVLAMGNMIKVLKKLQKDSKSFDNPVLSALVDSVKRYLESLIMEETDDLGPLEEGIESLQSVCRSLLNQGHYEGDISSILQRLDLNQSGPEAETKESGDKQVESIGDEMVVPGSAQDLDEEDREILNDFIIGSQDSLEAIEVSLIDLEQDPEDFETINSIFRPFHTIKGVTGFLKLNEINRLSHGAENLLDKARDGEIRIDERIIDVILETVDMLKRMISALKDRLEGGSSCEEEVRIEPMLSRIEEIITRKEQVGDRPIGEILVQKGAVTTEKLEDGLERQKDEPEKRIGEILVEDKSTESKDVVSALRDQKRFSKKQIDLHVKVDTKKLDNLVDLTGELVIAQAMLRQNEWILAGKDQKLHQNINQLNQITSGLQKTSMSMRMVPIKITFQKMVRLVRDLAKNSGKEVALEMVGEDTEIDRNLVEELYEPMVHMIRNSVDHGIETPEEREGMGKDKRGRIILKAYHQGGSIIIEISDDGCGLNRERILEKARSNNLITDESKLSESDIYNLIFRPGFSTTEEVTEISGRGVGMDVVKKAIEKLRGRTEIISNKDRGSTFIISLPLTLAIIEGMVVRVGRERYIIPALAILESFRPGEDQYSTVEGKVEMINLRGSLIPLIRLDRLFGVEGDSEKPWDGLVVAVENDGEKRCLLLDELLGKEEVVIKSIGDSLKETKGIAGGAIMGDGRVGLILDMVGIFELAMSG